MVTGPLGDPVEAGWRLDGRRAVIEMARASGLELVGGAEGNDPVAAATHGTGELIAAAVDAGARRVLVGVGGSATTDGGLGALRALHPLARLRGVELVVACDVRTRFVDAAAVLRPAEGRQRRRRSSCSPAGSSAWPRCTSRTTASTCAPIEGSGAAGGLAGGLAAIGAELVEGFELVADEVDLYGRIEGADLVVTGEGFLDDQSFEGKVVGGVADLAAEAGVPVVAVVGEVVRRRPPTASRSISLVERFGEERAMADTIRCVEEVVAELLASVAG